MIFFETTLYSNMNVSGTKVGFEGKRVMDKNGFEVPALDTPQGTPNADVKPGSILPKLTILGREVSEYRKMKTHLITDLNAKRVIHVDFLQLTCGEIIPRSWWIHPLNMHI